MRAYQIVYNEIDIEHENCPVMTSRIIYGVTLAAALNKFLEDNSPALDIKKIEEFNNKTTNKNRAKLKY
tara:strand:+ start:228 stop:434 length:207 start_codon:yes stop_codon:yes gene_type:complete